jgi:hypothetical protein
MHIIHHSNKRTRGHILVESRDRGDYLIHHKLDDSQARWIVSRGEGIAYHNQLQCLKQVQKAQLFIFSNISLVCPSRCNMSAAMQVEGIPIVVLLPSSQKDYMVLSNFRTSCDGLEQSTSDDEEFSR